MYSPDNADQSNLNDKGVCTALGTCNLDLTTLDVNQLQQLKVKFSFECNQYWCSGANRTNAVDCDNYGK